MLSEFVLNVNKSASGKAWISAEGDLQRAQILARQFDLPDAVASVLAARTSSQEDADAYLTPRLREQLPDPSDFLDMDVAVERVIAALNSNERIAILADYDVDGATSGALLRRFLAAVGGDTVTYVPDREKEGYGPNPQIGRAHV